MKRIAFLLISIVILAFQSLYAATGNTVYLPLVVRAEPPPTATATLTPPTATSIPPTNTPIPLTATATKAQNCDASYPTVCIPPPPPDLDCGDIPYRDFTVLQPDPHNFDRNNDGIGCESTEL